MANVAISVDKHKPTFALFPVNNNRTAWRRFGLPVVLVVPHSDKTDGSIANLRVVIENVGHLVPVAGHDHVGLFRPDHEVFARSIHPHELIGSRIDTNLLPFRRGGAEIAAEAARTGDYFTYTTASGVRADLMYVSGAFYFDLSSVMLATEQLPSGRYDLVYSCTYRTREVVDDGLLCIDPARNAVALLRFQLDHPGEILDAFHKHTPSIYLTNVNKAEDGTLAFYWPFTDILQDVYDEQRFLDRVNHIYTAPYEYLPYLSRLLGWDIPFFPRSLDSMRRAVLRTTTALQQLKGSKRVITEMGRLFGLNIVPTRLWYTTDGRAVVAPGERLPERYAAQQIAIRERCQVEPLLAGYTQKGFGNLSIPLLHRPQRVAGLDPFVAVEDTEQLTVAAYLVEAGGPAAAVLAARAAAVAANPNTAATCVLDSAGTLHPSDLTAALAGKPTLGTSLVGIVAGHGVNQQVTGTPPLSALGCSYDPVSNSVRLVFDGYLDLGPKQVLYVFACYRRQELVVPPALADLHSNRFNLQITQRLDDDNVRSDVVDFILDFVARVKAFHSLLNVVKFRFETTDVYQVTDWCCPPGTMVTMADGTPKPIELIEIGEFVLGHDGLPHRVSKTMSRAVDEDLIEIAAAGTGRTLRLTGQHPVYSCPYQEATFQKHWRKSSKRNRRAYRQDLAASAYRWVPAADIVPGDVLYAPIHAVAEQDSLNQEQAEFLGYYTAEGDASLRNARVRFSLSADEAALAQRICDLGIALGAKSASFTVTDPSRIAVHVYGLDLVHFCRQHCGSGARTKRLSTGVLTISRDRAFTFLRAYFIGDGSLKGGTAPQCQGHSASVTLIEQIYWMLSRHGLSSTKIFKKQRGGPGTRDREKLFDIAIINLPTKSARALWSHLRDQRVSMPCRHWHTGDHMAIRVKDVRRQRYIGTVYNLEVEDVNSYIADGVVVHNCVGGAVPQHPGVDAGKQQVPPAVRPRTLLPLCTDLAGLGFKPSDLRYRQRVLAGLLEEFQLWKDLDGRATIDNPSSLLDPLTPGLTAACRYTRHGQDRTLAARAETVSVRRDPDPAANSSSGGSASNVSLFLDLPGANNDASAYGSFTAEAPADRQPLCDLDGQTHCYVGRVHDTVLYRPTLAYAEPARGGLCAFGLGDGVYWTYPTPTVPIRPGSRDPGGDQTIDTQFSGAQSISGIAGYDHPANPGLAAAYDAPLDPSQDHWHGRLSRAYDRPAGQSIHYSNRPYLDEYAQPHFLSIIYPSLNITKTTLHLPGCRFPTMNRLKNDFTHPTWRAKPWDPPYSDPCNPTWLNARLVDGTDDNTALRFDDAPYKLKGNGLPPDISTLGYGQRASLAENGFAESDVVHSVRMDGAIGHPAVTLESVVECPTSVIKVAVPRFPSAEQTPDGAYNDFCDGYPAAAGRQEYLGEDLSRGGRFYNLLDAMGVPTVSQTAATDGIVSFLFRLGSGILVEKGFRLDCGCSVPASSPTGVVGGTNPTTPPGSKRLGCATDFFYQDGHRDWHADKLSATSRLVAEETIGVCSLRLDGSIPSLFELLNV